jgi:hypothetical protein
VRAVPCRCDFYPGICPTTEEKALKNLSQCKKNLSQVKKYFSQDTVYILHDITDSDNARCCINTIWPPEDEQDIARNMYM